VKALRLKPEIIGRQGKISSRIPQTKGIPEVSMQAVGYGELKPIDTTFLMQAGR
jgi:hypothetical protein